MDPLGSRPSPKEDTRTDETPSAGSPISANITAVFSRTGHRIENFFGSVAHIASKAGNAITGFFSRIAGAFSGRKQQEQLAADHVTGQLSEHPAIATANVHTTVQANEPRKRQDSLSADIPIITLDLKFIEEQKNQSANDATQGLSYSPAELDAGRKEQKIFEEKKLFSECYRQYTATKHEKWLSLWANSRGRGEGFDKNEQKLISDWLTEHLRNQADLWKDRHQLPNQKKLSEEMASPLLSGKPYIERLQIIIKRLVTAEEEKNNPLFADDQPTSQAAPEIDTRTTPHYQNGVNSEEEKEEITGRVNLSNFDWLQQPKGSDSRQSDKGKRK